MHSPIPIVDNNDSPLLILESLKTNQDVPRTISTKPSQEQSALKSPQVSAPTASDLRKNRRRRRLDRMNDLQQSSSKHPVDHFHQEGAGTTAQSQSPVNITHTSHQSKLNIKSRESSLLANIKKLDEEYREMKKPFVTNSKDKDDVVFYSGVGYKKVPFRQSFDDIPTAVKDIQKSAITSNSALKSPPKYKNLVQMMEPDDINHLMTYSPINRQSKVMNQ